MSDATLYTKCVQCSGRGRWTPPVEKNGNFMRIFGEDQCPKCDGFGMIFTQEGHEVVDIILQLRRIGRLN